MSEPLGEDKVTLWPAVERWLRTVLPEASDTFRRRLVRAIIAAARKVEDVDPGDAAQQGLMWIERSPEKFARWADEGKPARFLRRALKRKMREACQAEHPRMGNLRVRIPDEGAWDDAGALSDVEIGWAYATGEADTIEDGREPDPLYRRHVIHHATNTAAINAILTDAGEVIPAGTRRDFDVIRVGGRWVESPVWITSITGDRYLIGRLHPADKHAKPYWTRITAERYETQRERDVLAAALATLTTHERRLLADRYASGKKKPFRDIAEWNGIDKDTARSHIRTAETKVTKFVAENDLPFGET
ncbi:hypothetical protein [Jiangella sp. DSM 45060]|uniref:hypothetical protein n=1 Tax=Jiangella sp. DSM 45060 TaxID=1798224 RepID=UPI00087C5D4A|nr:hypothetical protein [Jiangella sp. DSM 45060]SDT35557.1 hypothetical protein SAMN04515669_3688 [Jiangella sp. DSM 45060]